LDKALTPSQNAQRYFKRYQKLKEAVKHLTSLIQETKETISYLETVETALAQASLSEVAEIREELIQTGFIKRRNREKIHKRKKPEKYLASDGKTIILVGRNNLQNEELTFKMAKKDELWFHAKDIPGSHVVITGNLNAVRYREDILLPHVVPFLQAHPDMTLQHDNATSHTARSVCDFL